MSGIRRCEVIGLDQIYELACELSRAVRAAQYAPELVIAVARGGFVPARLVCDFLQCADLTSITIRHYAAGGRREATARIQHPLGTDLRGRRVLVVDDVNDTGDTLEVARAHLAERGAGEVRIGVLHEKSRSHARAEFAAAAVGDTRWLVYQWALVEDTLGFLARLDPPPDTAAECRERLKAEFGLDLDPAQWQLVAPWMQRPLL